MKAIVIRNFGPPDVMKYEDVPDPVPRQGEIRIRIHAATVNRVLDVSLRAGKEPRRKPVLPLIPGVDCAGIVDAVGPGVTRWKVGERVAAAGTMPSSCATHRPPGTCWSTPPSSSAARPC
jgi:NADPH2:quinone reductase